jgi:hypothetical protein
MMNRILAAGINSTRELREGTRIHFVTENSPNLQIKPGSREATKENGLRFQPWVQRTG